MSNHNLLKVFCAPLKSFFKFFLVLIQFKNKIWEHFDNFIHTIYYNKHIFLCSAINFIWPQLFELHSLQQKIIGLWNCSLLCAEIKRKLDLLSVRHSVSVSVQLLPDIFRHLLFGSQPAILSTVNISSQHKLIFFYFSFGLFQHCCQHETEKLWS